MPNTRTVKKIFNWKPLTKRSQGRPKYRWEDNIKQDIWQLKIQNWIACVQDRGKWKEVVEKTKTFNYRKFSAWKKKCLKNRSGRILRVASCKKKGLLDLQWRHFSPNNTASCLRRLKSSGTVLLGFGLHFWSSFVLPYEPVSWFV